MISDNYFLHYYPCQRHLDHRYYSCHEYSTKWNCHGSDSPPCPRCVPHPSLQRFPIRSYNVSDAAQTRGGAPPATQYKTDLPIHFSPGGKSGPINSFDSGLHFFILVRGLRDTQGQGWHFLAQRFGLVPGLALAKAFRVRLGTELPRALVLSLWEGLGRAPSFCC